MDINLDITKELLAEITPIIGLYPGKFKPPHKGHFYVVENAAKICDEVHIIISNNIHEGYDDYSSKKVWETYLKHLPNNVKIRISEASSPVTEVYNEIKNQDNLYLVLYGKDEEGRFKAINENREKYWNTQVIDAGNKENISSTQLREHIKNRDIDGIKQLIPEQVSVHKFLFNFQLHEIKVNQPIKYEKAFGESHSYEEYKKNCTECYHCANHFLINKTTNKIIASFTGYNVARWSGLAEKQYPNISRYDKSTIKNPPPYFNIQPIDIDDPVSWDSSQVPQLIRNWQKSNINEIKIQTPGINFPKDKDWVYYLKDENHYNKIYNILIKNGWELKSPFKFSYYYNENDNPTILYYSNYQGSPKFHISQTEWKNLLDSYKHMILNPQDLPKVDENVLEQIENSLNKDLDEAKQLGDLYHFTSLKSILNIISSDELQSSQTYPSNYERDFQFYGKDEKEFGNTSSDIAMIRLNYLSTTRDKLLYKKDPKIYGSGVRIMLDGNKLSTKYKIKPFFYYKDEWDDINSRVQQDESEERIDLKQNKSIPLSPYLKGIDIILDEVSLDSNFYLKILKQLEGMNNPKIRFLYKEKPISLEEFSKLMTNDDDVEKLITSSLNKDLGEIKVNKPIHYKIKLLQWLKDPTQQDDEFIKEIIPEVESINNEKELDYLFFNIFFGDRDNGINNKEYLQFKQKILNGDLLSEIKVNKPGLNFPIKITSLEQAQKVGKELKRLGYIWDNAEIIDITDAPFKTNFFEPFMLYKGRYKGTIDWDLEVNESKLLKEVFDGNKHQNTLYKAIDYVCKDLNIEKPEIELIDNPEYTQQHSSFGGYVPSEKKIYAVVYNRNMADIMRSIAHELRHMYQDEQGLLTMESGKDGDEMENDANSYAGKIMRKIGRELPEIFENQSLNEIKINSPKIPVYFIQTPQKRTEYLKIDGVYIQGEYYVDENTGDLILIIKLDTHIPSNILQKIKNIYKKYLISGEREHLEIPEKDIKDIQISKEDNLIKYHHYL